MSELRSMTSILFPNQPAPFEVVDSEAREGVRQLSEEIDGVGAFVVKVVMDVDNGAALTSDKTYDEIKNAVIDGQDIVCVKYDVVDGAVAAINRYSSVQLTVDVDLEECVVAYDLLTPLNGGMIAGLKFKNSEIENVKDRDFMLGRGRIYVKGCFFMTSSTPGSKKLFRIQVDDSGVLSATEVTS